MTKNVILSRWEDTDFLSAQGLPVSVAREDIEAAILDADPTSQKRWANWIAGLWVNRAIQWKDLSEGSTSRVGTLLRDYEIVRPHLAAYQKSLMLHNSLEDIYNVIQGFGDIRALTLDTIKAQNESLFGEYESGLSITLPLTKHAAIVNDTEAKWFGPAGKLFQAMYDEGPVALLSIPGGGRYLIHFDVSDEVSQDNLSGVFSIKNERNESLSKREWKEIHDFYHDFESAVRFISKGFSLNMDRSDFISEVLCLTETMAVGDEGNSMTSPDAGLIRFYSDDAREILANPLSAEAREFYYCPPDCWCPSDLSDPVEMDIVKVSSAFFMQDAEMQSLFAHLRERRMTWGDFSVGMEDIFTRRAKEIDCLPGQTIDDVISSMKETMKTIEDERDTSEWRVLYPER